MALGAAGRKALKYSRLRRSICGPCLAAHLPLAAAHATVSRDSVDFASYAVTRSRSGRQTSVKAVDVMNFLSWEMWVPLMTGMVVGIMSLLAVLSLASRRRAVPAAPPAKGNMPAPDPFVHGSATEQRKSLRRGGNPVPVFLKTPEDKQPSWRGWVFDRSMGGLGMVVDC